MAHHLHGEEPTPVNGQGEDVDLVDHIEKVLQTGKEIQNVHESHDQKEKARGMSTKFLRAEGDDRQQTAGVTEEIQNDT